ncbi:MAG: hypothetical protein JWP52_4103, partial [Rhizobacter sp.]|nr:hypothetical protein [Rhizobacter sp.]
GLYQAAWTLGGLYVGFVLQAMGADFYPRLVGAANDHPRCNRLVNEQALVSLLLAGPGVVGTLTLASVVVVVFYSSMFEGAVETLRWICLGMALRVVTWPLGYVIVAKAEQKLFVATEVAWAAGYVLLTWGLVHLFGFRGVGMAFFASYLVHLAIVYPIVARLTGFRWSADNLRAAALMLAAGGLVFCGFGVLRAPWALAFGLAVSLLLTAYSVRTLARLLPASSVPPVFRRILRMHAPAANAPTAASPSP